MVLTAVFQLSFTVSEILLEINLVWDELVSVWGDENARAVCRIQMFVTDTNNRLVTLLKQDLLHHSLGQQQESRCRHATACIHFERPDFAITRST